MAARATLPGPVVLVPTMGALHDGHRVLLRRGRQICGRKGSLVVSVFVNPLQFEAGADLDRYPRDLAADLGVCAQEDVDLVFAPLATQMYPAAQVIMIDPGPPGNELEGAFRPGFFNGVLTVVLKILNLVRPDAAVFGEKDAQQLFLVRRMVADLNLAVEIEAVPTAREPDGVAASSRNIYLSAEDRVTARALSRALLAGAAVAGQGRAAVMAAAAAVLDVAGQADPPLVLDYLELVEQGTFTPAAPGYAGPAVLLVAGTVGKTRLIDNTPLTLRAAPAAGETP
ncbi:MAG TPA: pantoate--beta-alanine ligase [Streptosporangiaceae bacterium]|nr:pantoate--beta-alanine ligase [Streptosporangiaceae bacterium]